MKSDLKDGKHIFRVDRFKVPAASRAEFLERSRATHELLRTFPGFVEDFFLESPGDGGVSNIVTIVIWKDAAAFDAARTAAQQHYRQIGFNPGETVKRLGIEADMLAYTELKR
jgi:heme-degrading monooxygenase HmoA